jgi:hypothetical protein
MGHKRLAPAPSPLQLFAIFDAYSRGQTMPAISKRTRYSVSTLLRWYNQWGHEYVTWRRLAFSSVGDPMFEETYDRFYPALPQGELPLGNEQAKVQAAS